MSRAAAIALAAALAVPAGACHPAGPAPEATVRALYSYHFAHEKGFTPTGLEERSAWLSSDLLALCRTYFAAPSSPNEVPAIDGDPFTDSQEYPDSFAVGVARIDGNAATVPVTMLWPSAPRRTVTVVLVKDAKGWLVSDLRYESGPTFRATLSADQ